MSISPKMSAVICTHNRAERLRYAIESVLHQSLASEEYEVIVVDNRSTDDTPGVVSAMQRSSRNIRYVTESQLGLNPARNTGWRMAEGRYVAFLDDDAIASRVWLEKLVSAFETVSPVPAAVGGRIDPIWEVSRPTWLSDSMLDMYSLCDYSADGHFLLDVIHRRNLVGANMAVSKSALEAVGGFAPGLDRIGENLLSGGDLLLQVKLEENGMPIYYEPQAVVSHLVPAARVNKEWLLRRYYWGGISDALLVHLRTSRSLFRSSKLVLYATRMLMSSPRVCIDYFGRSDNPGELSKTARACAKIGFFVGAIRAFGLYLRGDRK